MNIPFDPNTWSALAAGFSAIVAWFSWRLQRQSQVDSARPELVFERCEVASRSQDQLEVVVHGIRNVGVGTARDVVVSFEYHGVRGHPDFFLGPAFAALVAGQTAPCPVGGVVDNPEARQGKVAPVVDLVIDYYDRFGNAYRQTHHLLLNHTGAVFQSVGESIGIVGTVIEFEPRWRHSAKQKLRNSRQRVKRSWDRIWWRKRALKDPASTP